MHDIAYSSLSVYDKTTVDCFVAIKFIVFSVVDKLLCYLIITFNRLYFGNELSDHHSFIYQLLCSLIIMFNRLCLGEELFNHRSVTIINAYVYMLISSSTHYFSKKI